LAQLRIDGLQGIVPVAVAVLKQPRAGDEASRQRGEQLVDVRSDGV
jgi:hypothetical protein